MNLLDIFIQNKFKAEFYSEKSGFLCRKILRAIRIRSLSKRGKSLLNLLVLALNKYRFRGYRLKRCSTSIACIGVFFQPKNKQKMNMTRALFKA